jgi:hypothetical protein
MGSQQSDGQLWRGKDSRIRLRAVGVIDAAVERDERGDRGDGRDTRTCWRNSGAGAKHLMATGRTLHTDESSEFSGGFAGSDDRARTPEFVGRGLPR